MQSKHKKPFNTENLFLTTMKKKLRKRKEVENITSQSWF